MGMSYRKLWKLLIDKKMNKTDLIKASGISTSSMAKLSKGDNVQTDVLVRICYTLKCDTSDIMEYEYDEIDANVLASKNRRK